MAGTITIDTLRDGAGNTGSATDAIKGSARAWVNFNGVSTASIRASYNVSSVTRNAAGDYTVNFTNAMPDADFVAAIIPIHNSATYQYAPNFSGAPSSSSLRFVCTYDGGGSAGRDISYVYVSIFR
jgi:hypothetical protein